MRWLAILVVAFGLAAPAQDEARTHTLADDEWPERLTAGLGQFAASVPSILSREHADSAGEPRRGDGDDDALRIRRAEPHGLGIVLEVATGTPAETQPSSSPAEFVFVSYPPLQPESVNVGVEVARHPMEITFADVERGVRWELYEPKVKLARGLVVHLGGNKYVRRALLADGWVVLTSSGTGRYFERRSNPQTFEIKSDADVAIVGARIAAAVDDELADWPYSLEAVLSYLAIHRPEIPQQPAVVMGFSIGAIGLPAVAARMPKRFAAAVIVAGGADLLKISQTSRKANPGIELRWTPPAREENLFAKLDAAYLSNAKLDPYSAAATLGDMPVLMFHASFDQVVTAKAGNLLWNRLGKPERRVFPVGHGHMLRVAMRMQAGQIAKWTAAPTGPDETP